MDKERGGGFQGLEDVKVREGVKNNGRGRAEHSKAGQRV